MTPNLLISMALYTVLGIGAFVALYGWLQIRSFLSTFTSIDCQQDFDEFRRVVKTDMYLALLWTRISSPEPVIRRRN